MTEKERAIGQVTKLETTVKRQGEASAEIARVVIQQAGYIDTLTSGSWWVCKSCNAHFPHIDGDEKVTRCTSCVEAEMLREALRTNAEESKELRKARDALTVEVGRLQERNRMMEIALMRPDRPVSTPDFLRFVAERLVIHGDSPNLDVVLSLRDRADEIDAVMKLQKHSANPSTS